MFGLKRSFSYLTNILVKEIIIVHSLVKRVSYNALLVKFSICDLYILILCSCYRID